MRDCEEHRFADRRRAGHHPVGGYAREAFVDQVLVCWSAAQIAGIVGTGVALARLHEDQRDGRAFVRDLEEVKRSVVILARPAVTDTVDRELGRPIFDRDQSTYTERVRFARWRWRGQVLPPVRNAVRGALGTAPTSRDRRRRRPPRS